MKSQLDSQLDSKIHQLEKDPGKRKRLEAPQATRSRSAPRQYGGSVDVAVQPAEAAACVWFRLQFAVGRWCFEGHVDVACSLRSPVC